MRAPTYAPSALRWTWNGREFVNQYGETMTEPRIERIGDAILYLGDCYTLLAQIQADAVVTDPPYGIAYKLNMPSRLNTTGNLNNETVTGDDKPFDPAPFLTWPCVLFGADHYAPRLSDGGTMHVWDKHCGRAANDSFSDAELFWINKRTKRHVFRYLWKGIQQEGAGEKRYHPTAKPVELMKFCIERVSPAETIFDPFMGSGTTGVACAALGRKFVGVEIEPKYFAIACERISAAYAQGRLQFSTTPRLPE